MAAERVTHVLMGLSSTGDKCIIGYSLPDLKYSAAIIYEELFDDFISASSTPELRDLVPERFLTASTTAQDALSKGALKLNRPVYVELRAGGRNQKTVDRVFLPGEYHKEKAARETSGREQPAQSTQAPSTQVSQPLGFIGAASFTIDATVREWLDKKIGHIKDADRRQEAAHMFLSALYVARYVSTPESGMELIKALSEYYARET